MPLAGSGHRGRLMKPGTRQCLRSQTKRHRHRRPKVRPSRARWHPRGFRYFESEERTTLQESGTSMGLPLFLVDAFADRPFAGNPAAVCLLEALARRAMAAKRRGRNATVGDGVPGAREGRIRTPLVHAQSRSRPLRARDARLGPRVVATGPGTAGRGDRVFHAQRHPPGRSQPGRNRTRLSAQGRATREPPPTCSRRIGVTAKYVGRNQFDYLIEVESEAVLRQMTPDFKRLATVPVRGTIVTSRSSNAQIRFRVPIFRPSSRHRRRPGHRLGALLFGGLLAQAARQK